jgi:hypothetical protein
MGLIDDIAPGAWFRRAAVLTLLALDRQDRAAAYGHRFTTGRVGNCVVTEIRAFLSR